MMSRRSDPERIARLEQEIFYPELLPEMGAAVQLVINRWGPMWCVMPPGWEGSACDFSPVQEAWPVQSAIDIHGTIWLDDQ